MAPQCEPISCIDSGTTATQLCGTDRVGFKIGVPNDGEIAGDDG